MSEAPSEKRCFKCGEIKPLSEFYKHPQMGDGHVNKCKECNKKDVTENREKNLERIQEYDRKRRKKEFVSEERWAELREQDTARNKAYRERYPIKDAAHTLVGNHIRDGKLIRQPCEVCGELKVHAHHNDYSKPLEVNWLCSEHHARWHAEHGEGLNGS